MNAKDCATIPQFIAVGYSITESPHPTVKIMKLYMMNTTLPHVFRAALQYEHYGNRRYSNQGGGRGDGRGATSAWHQRDRVRATQVDGTPAYTMWA